MARKSRYRRVVRSPRATPPHPGSFAEEPHFITAGGLCSPHPSSILMPMSAAIYSSKILLHRLFPPRQAPRVTRQDRSVPASTPCKGNTTPTWEKGPKVRSSTPGSTIFIANTTTPRATIYTTSRPTTTPKRSHSSTACTTPSRWLAAR